LKISHDKVSGALYIDLREGEYDHTEDYSEKADVYLDVDAEGNVLGLEALSFEDLAQAIEERGGKLELPDRLAALADENADANVGKVAALTPRQREVLQLLAEGKTNQEIAEHLSISLITVKQHIAGVIEDLGVSSRDEVRGAGQAEDIDESAGRLGGYALEYDEDDSTSDEDALSARRRRGNR